MEEKLKEDSIPYQKNTSLREFLTHFIENMPNLYDIDDVMQELYIKKKIDEGLNDLDNNRTTSFEDMKKKFENL
ncbi:MAG: hypothetical protein LAT82_00745 [Nanoarchaeota archaeon]|nr:hypothetical protein [Nanoarchaeota archaeon]